MARQRYYYLIEEIDLNTKSKVRYMVKVFTTEEKAQKRLRRYFECEEYAASCTGNKKPQDTLDLGYFRTHDNREYRISQAFAG